MKIGIMGGTFDPPHYGHLALLRAAKPQLELDEVILLPAHRNPFKSGRMQSDGQHRLEMCRLLAAELPGVAVSDLELTRGGVSYTVDTLSELQMVHPGEYWFIMGADSLSSFGTWKNPTRILRMCRLAVAVRPPITENELLTGVPEEVREKVDVIEMPSADVSSTEIRNKIERGQPVSTLLPASILDYIRKNKLYTPR